MSSLAPSARRTVMLAMTVALGAAGGVVAAPVAAHAVASEPGTVIAELTNQARSDNGVEPVLYSDQLQAVAQAWADELASRATLEHNPEVADQIPPHWLNLGENVASGSSVTPAGMHEMWLGSEGHFQNILNPDFTVMGVGYAEGSDGSTYAVEVFAGYVDPSEAGAAPIGAEPSAEPAATPEQSTPAAEPSEAAPAESSEPTPEKTPSAVPAPPASTPAGDTTTAAAVKTAAAEPTSTAVAAAGAQNDRLSSTGVNGMVVAGIALSGLLAVVSGAAFLSVYRQRRSSA